MWLECIGVVSGCCCKKVYRHPHITYTFFAAASLLLCSFLKCFFVLVFIHVFTINFPFVSCTIVP